MLGRMEHAGRSGVRLLAGIALGLVAAGCGDVTLGAVPGLIFWAGAEPGDTSEWTAGDAGGTTFTEALGQVEVVTAPVRRGTHAFLLNINDPNDTLTQATLFRNGPFPGRAYYSAWFRLVETHTTSYWAIMKIQARTDPADPLSVINIFDLVLESDAAGTLTFFLSDHRTNEKVARSTMPVPIGDWFHVEMFVDATPDPTGSVAVWQDGVRVLGVDNIATAPSDFLLFGVGNIATAIMPTLATIEIDDAAVSLERLGP
jgi:Polysaccharide lyase